MAYFTLLFFKMIPLYATIGMGYIAGKWLDASRETLARILFFLITPVIIFNGVINTRLDISILALPLLTFTIGSGLCLLFYKLSESLWKDSSKNLVALSAGTGNTGYFGLPLAILLFDDQGEGIYLLALLGITLYENSVGYYIIAKGTHTTSESLSKLIKLPSLYAFGCGLIWNFCGFSIPEMFKDFAGHLKGAYTILGMMMIGIGISNMNRFFVDYSFLGMTFLAKFIAWPALVLLVIAIDASYLHFFYPAVYQALILISVVPLAANLVVFASLFKSHPEKAATAVIISTLFALIYVPIMISSFI